MKNFCDVILITSFES